VNSLITPIHQNAYRSNGLAVDSKHYCNVTNVRKDEFNPGSEGLNALLQARGAVDL